MITPPLPEGQSHHPRCCSYWSSGCCLWSRPMAVQAVFLQSPSLMTTCATLKGWKSPRNPYPFQHLMTNFGVEFIRS